MSATAEEREAALVMIERGLTKGFHARVYDKAGTPDGPFTAEPASLAFALGGSPEETVVFAAPPVRSGDRYAHRGFITFVWGNGPDDVVHDFADNLYIREIVGQPKGDD